MTASFPATQAIWPTLLRLPGAVDQGDSCLHLRPLSLRSQRERLTLSLSIDGASITLAISCRESRICTFFSWTETNVLLRLRLYGIYSPNTQRCILLQYLYYLFFKCAFGTNLVGVYIYLVCIWCLTVSASSIYLKSLLVYWWNKQSQTTLLGNVVQHGSGNISVTLGSREKRGFFGSYKIIQIQMQYFFF